MKALSAVVATFAVIILAAIFLPGCLKDTRSHIYKLYTPVYKTTEDVRANIKSNSVQPIKNPGKLFIKGQYIFLNEIDKGIHIIDNSNPSNPKNVAFIDIPGNMDLAVKGDVLYADLYTDLITLDISDPLHVVKKKIIDNAFPERRYANGFVPSNQKIIVDWIIKDTTVVEDLGTNNSWGCANCMVADALLFSSSSAPSSKTPFGVGGSMARFSIINSTLFTVGTTNLNVYSISTPENPVFSTQVGLGMGIETVYPFKDRLFIGSSNGMLIYDVSNPASPSRLGQFGHVTACDPVIADDDYAFVTLSSGVRCSNASNQMDVLDISSLTAPTLVKTYPLTNPHGLSKDDNTLFVCDGTDGLKVYDASNVKDLKLITQLKGFESYDVIAFNKLAIVVSKDGLRQFDYSNPNNIKLVSMLGWAL